MKLSHAIGFDDFPFARQHRGNVRVVGAVYAATRLEGVLSAQIRRDGSNSTRVLEGTVRASKFYAHCQLLMLQGIALGGFNVIDLHGLASGLERPVLIVCRKAPDLAAIRQALETRVPGGKRKWRLIERAGAMEPLEGVYVQRAGLSLLEAQEVLRRFTVQGRIPEPLRAAHLIASGVGSGQSRARP